MIMKGKATLKKILVMNLESSAMCDYAVHPAPWLCRRWTERSLLLNWLSMCFNVIHVMEIWNSLLWVFLWSVFKCVHKAYKQFICKCWSFTCTLNFNSSFFILHLFFMLTTSRTQRGFKMNFIKMWNEKHF